MIYWFKVQEKLGKVVLMEIDKPSLSAAFDGIRKYYPFCKVFAITEDDARGLLKSMRHEKIYQP